MNELNFGEFWENFKTRRLSIDRKILFIEWEITYKCNFDCLHCYLPKGYKNDKKKELDLKQIKIIMDKFKELGVLWIIFSGGEPFMRDDFLEILKIAYKKGFLIGIMTNGSLIDDKALAILKKYPPMVIDLPIFSISSYKHDKFTGFEGSYRKLLDLVRKIKSIKAKYPIWTFKVILNKFNKREIFKLRDLVNSWGFNFRYSPIIYPTIRGDFAPCALRLNPTEIVNIEKDDMIKVRKLMKRQLGKGIGYHNGRFIGCDFGKSRLVLDPYGYLRACALLRYPKFKILGNSFRFIKDEFDRFLRKVTQNPCSLNCRYVNFCDLCPPKAYLEKGDYRGPLKFYCDLAQKRYNLFMEVKNEGSKQKKTSGRRKKEKISISSSM